LEALAMGFRLYPKVELKHMQVAVKSGNVKEDGKKMPKKGDCEEEIDNLRKIQLGELKVVDNDRKHVNFGLVKATHCNLKHQSKYARPLENQTRIYTIYGRNYGD
jgi:hypothetical protein